MEILPVLFYLREGRRWIFFRRDLEENLMKVDESRLKVPWFVKGRGCGCGNR